MKRWVEQWMQLHASLLFFGTLLLLFTKTTSRLPWLAAFSFFLLFFFNARRLKHWSFLWEAANLVSLFRLGSILLLFHFASQLAPFFIGIIALTVLCLDGLDGYLARRFRTASDFGAYLDMETDAFYVLSLCVLLYEQNYFGAWILFIGLLRYGYFLLLINHKTPEQKEQRLFSAQLIAVILMASLALCFILPAAIHRPVAMIASALVLYSFGRSFWLATSQRAKKST